MSSAVKPTVIFWIIAVVALLWNLMGVAAYIFEATSDVAGLLGAGYSEFEANSAKSRSAWATGAFALAVFGGALGCLALLLRKKWAVTLFIVSLLGVIVQQIYIFGMTDAASYISGAAWIMPAMIPIVAIFLVWFAKRNADRGVLT